MTADKRLFFVRAMVQTRIGEQAEYNHVMAFDLLKKAHAAGVSVETLEELAKSLTGKTWADLGEAINMARAAIKVNSTAPTVVSGFEWQARSRTRILPRPRPIPRSGAVRRA